ncbi:unnamed protein product [Candidula unifasciata]|uniref:Histone RNA hairpin-binding protein RNA-binding domain-containing protein n=1 Tax=Candidula unifasciata TaxID=100452 RepID=A0A8S3YX82_9EUPU|nr:unnamed protein product [Candidula unifasciata]
MAETMVTNSSSWAELTESMEIDSDLPSECGAVETAEKKPDKTEIKPVICKQIPDNDLRKKLNKNRGLENEDELQATTSKSKNRASSVGGKYTRVRPPNDLRMKLNRNRGEPVSDTSEPQQGRHSPSDRSKYTERQGGLSPLRSPINRSKQKTIFDIDNSRNFRFTKNRVATSQVASALDDGENRGGHKCMRSPPRSEKHKYLVKSQGIDTTPSREESGCKTSLSDCNRETPGHSVTPEQISRHSWSRRKLLLPSENNGPEDRPAERVPEAKEDDELKLARREKDIFYGKNTDAYRLYIDEVPVKERVWKVHPRTPDKFRKCSRRSWDTQVKIWKRRLHVMAAELQKDRDIICACLRPQHLSSCVVFSFLSVSSRSDILQETHLEVKGSSSESKTDDEDFLDILDDDTVELLDNTLLIKDA